MNFRFFRHLGLSFLLILQSILVFADECSQLLLEQAKADIFQTVKKSKNYMPLSRFLVSTEFKMSPTANSETLGELGQIQFSTHLKTGRSTIELIDAKTGARTKLFTTDEIEVTKRSGRIASMRVSDDATEIVIAFRAYNQPGHPMTEFRRKLPAQVPKEFAGKMLIDPRRTLQSIALKNGSKLRVMSYGMNASTDVVRVDSSSQERILFSTFQNVRNNSVQFNDVSISPDERFVAFRSFKDGSLDEFDLEVFDLNQNKSVYRAKAGSSDLTWLDDGELQYQQYSPEPGQILMVVKLDATNTSEIPIRPAPKGIADFWDEIGRIGDEIFYISNNSQTNAKAIKAVSVEDRKKGDGSRARWVIGPNKPDFILDTATILDDVIVASYHSGPRKARMLVDAQGKTLASFWLPEYCSLNWMVWKKKNETLTLSYGSALNPNVQVDLDIKTLKYSDGSFQSKLLDYNGKSYVSEIVEVASADRTKVPVRITRLKDLPQDAERPVYMTVYGGFNIENSGFSPVFDSISREFLARGGIVVSPGVRGGNEYGEPWHQGGAGLNKQNTFADVAATAQYMVQQGWTTPRNIILTGTSNGGLTTAATALMYPDLFGLVIPINGVLDLVQAELWDRKFRGWNYEYGKNDDASALANKKKLSPMLRAQNLRKDQELPEFFIVNGENDSRVNAKHSHNLYATLVNKNSEEIDARMLVLPHAGHWLASPYYQKVIGWHTKVVIWTRIFDYLGWKFE